MDAYTRAKTMKAAKKSFTEIAQVLNKEGYKTRSGKKFDYNSTYSLFKNGETKNTKVVTTTATTKNPITAYTSQLAEFVFSKFTAEQKLGAVNFVIQNQ